MSLWYIFSFHVGPSKPPQIEFIILSFTFKIIFLNFLFTSFFHRCKIHELKEKSRGETNEYKVHFRNRRCCFWPG